MTTRREEEAGECELRAGMSEAKGENEKDTHLGTLRRFES